MTLPAMKFVPGASPGYVLHKPQRVNCGGPKQPHCKRWTLDSAVVNTFCLGSPGGNRLRSHQQCSQLSTARIQVLTRSTFISLAYQILKVDSPYIFLWYSEESIRHFQGVIQNLGRQQQADH